MRIALLEDDEDQALLVKSWIAESGHSCAVFNLGMSLIHALDFNTFDVLILDWTLPDIEGIDVLKWVRKNIDHPVPVLFITAKDSEESVVFALNAGADDYMAKPIRKQELLARINVLLRRIQSNSFDSDEIKLKYGAYTIIPNTSSVLINNDKINVTQKEYELFVFLFKNIGRIISRHHILESVWGLASELNTRTVDTHMSRVRTKLMLKGEYGWQLRSIYQHGYRLEAVDENAGLLGSDRFTPPDIDV